MKNVESTQDGSKQPSCEDDTKSETRIKTEPEREPNASGLGPEEERSWLKSRVHQLFESDPRYGNSFLRKVVKATKIDLDLLATAAGNEKCDFEAMHDLERIAIVLYSRLDAALDLDEYFEHGDCHLDEGEEFERERRAAKRAEQQKPAKGVH